MIVDGYDGFAPFYVGRHIDGRSRGSVVQGVGHQVAQGLAKMGLDAQDDHGLGRLKGHRSSWCRRSGVAAGVGGQDGEVDGCPFGLAHLVEPGQQQQVFHETLHAGRLLLDAPHDGGLVDPGVLCAEAEQLGETLDRCERRPQFV